MQIIVFLILNITSPCTLAKAGQALREGDIFRPPFNNLFFPNPSSDNTFTNEKYFTPKFYLCLKHMKLIIASLEKKCSM